MIKVEQAINKNSKRIKETQWYKLGNMISTNESNNTFTQNKDASNLTFRINPHDLYSANKTE